MFSTYLLKERLRSADLVAFALILSGVIVAMTAKKGGGREAAPADSPLAATQAGLLPLSAAGSVPSTVDQFKLAGRLAAAHYDRHAEDGPGSGGQDMEMVPLVHAGEGSSGRISELPEA